TRVGRTACFGARCPVTGTVPPVGAPPPPGEGDGDGDPGGAGGAGDTTRSLVNSQALCSSGLSSIVAFAPGTSMMKGSCGSGGVATHWMSTSFQPSRASCITVK